MNEVKEKNIRLEKQKLLLEIELLKKKIIIYSNYCIFKIILNVIVYVARI